MSQRFDRLLSEFHGLKEVLNALRKELVESVNKNTQTREQTPQPTVIVRPEFNVPQPPAPDQSTAPKDHPKREGLRILLEFLTLGAVVWYGCTAKRQLTTMNNTFIEMQKQTIAAQCAAKTARDQATQSIIASRIDERAWMEITAQSFIVALQKPLIVNLQMKNVGKTPALDYKWEIVSEIVSGSEEPKFTYEKPKPCQGLISLDSDSKGFYATKAYRLANATGGMLSAE